MDEFRSKLSGSRSERADDDDPDDVFGPGIEPPAANVAEVDISEEILRDLKRRAVLYVGCGASQLDDRIYIRDKLHQVQSFQLPIH
jgi:hypothetical protein